MTGNKDVGQGAQEMTGRERFLRCIHGQPVDRVPNFEGGLWGKTAERWFREGLPKETHEYEAFLEGSNVKLREGSEYFGLDRWGDVRIRTRLVPGFEEEIFEETERYVVYLNRNGQIRRRMREDRLTSMDQYLSFPVTDREDFLSLKEHLDPTSPTRYPQFWADEVRKLKGRDYPLLLPAGGEFGFYSRLRELMGTEALSYAWYDHPSFIEEMLDFFADFIIETLRPAVEDIAFESFMFFEDMAGKGGPLMSPKMFRQFLMPRYRKVIDFLRRNNVGSIWVDSDGDCRPLIPIWLELGVDMFIPCEVAAGMDLLEIRREYGEDVGLCGGIDKRQLTKDKKAVEDELYGKVPTLLEQGRYIPMVDHAVPPDIPFENYVYYLELKRRLLETG